MADLSPSLQKLADAGVPVDAIDDHQRSVLDGLSDDESQLLAGIMEKLKGDVDGFSMQAIRPSTSLPGTGLKPGGIGPKVGPVGGGIPHPGELGATDTGYVFW